MQSIARIFQNTNGTLKVIKLLGKPAFGKPVGDWYTWVCARVAREQRVIIYAWLTSVYLLQIYSSIVRSPGFRQRSGHDHPARKDVSARTFKQSWFSSFSPTCGLAYIRVILRLSVFPMIFLLDHFYKLMILQCNIRQQLSKQIMNE